MDRSTILTFLMISVGFILGGAISAISGSQTVIALLHRNAVPANHLAGGVILLLACYVWVRGAVCLVASLRWANLNWRFSRRQDLARQGLLRGAASAFELHAVRQSTARALEYVEIMCIAVFCVIATWYLLWTGVCQGPVTLANSCIGDVGMLTGAPWFAIVVRYVFAWGPQPRRWPLTSL
jgi:hypothetical protein